MKFDRAWRRLQTARLKKARKLYWSWDEKTPRLLSMLTNNPQKCSCFMCGNQRPYEGLTKQEKFHLVDYRDGIDAVSGCSKNIRSDVASIIVGDR